MFDPDRLIPYTLAAFLLVLVPGPAQAMVIARSLNGGRRSGITASLGLNTGTLVHTFAAALGLSAILATSAVAFSVVKFAGAAYLVFLGIQLLRARSLEPDPVPESVRLAESGPGAYGRAVLTGILNPKVAVFFLAFLPQFVDRDAGSVFLQFLILGLIFSVIAISVDSLLATAAGSLGRFLARNPTVAIWRERVTGVAFVALGIRLAFEKR